jgi:hypothetical protein
VSLEPLAWFSARSSGLTERLWSSEMISPEDVSIANKLNAGSCKWQTKKGSAGAAKPETKGVPRAVTGRRDNHVKPQG